MDIIKALRELYEELRRLDRAIDRLETRLKAKPLSPANTKRGRKSMSPEERLEVSRRMAAYWKRRRAERKKTDSNST